MPFLHPHPQSSSDDAHLCDRTSITEDHLAWLYDVRIIGRNSVTGKCYISGPAKVVKARRSIPLVELLDTADDDPPDMEQAEIINNGGKRCLYMYHMDHRHYQPTWQVPAHAACIVLLEKALSWRMNGDTEGNILDKEKLVRAIQAADPDEYARRLGKLNCFEFEDVEKDPLWQGVRGFEVSSLKVSSMTSNLDAFFFSNQMHSLGLSIHLISQHSRLLHFLPSFTLLPLESLGMLSQIHFSAFLLRSLHRSPII